jgi:plastocyanin
VDLRTGTTTVIRAGFATEAALSPDGRWVAFVAGTRLQLRDLATGTTKTLPTAGARVLDPAVARGGRVVAFTAVRGGRARVEAWRRGTSATVVVSRATGRAGAIADRDATDPSISDDGRRVAFASAATNLATAKTDAKPAVFVRDLRRARTQLVSDPTAAYPPRALASYLASARAAGPPAAARARHVKLPTLGADEVAITDNAFFAGTDRPTIRIRAGQSVTWEWASRESHSVAVQSGPERFATAVEHGTRFTHSFERAGTYQLVCSLHAPGMRMTVVVQ